MYTNANMPLVSQTVRRVLKQTAPRLVKMASSVDEQFPGTATDRMAAVRERVQLLTPAQLSGEWEDVRRSILWAGGLKDIRDRPPGQGNTSHSFNDWNHCDLTAMNVDVAHNENGGQVAGIAAGNQLGHGIKAASDPELGAGGSWSTCIMGCNSDPPRDVAHLQFRARIAFKLVWCPPSFGTFVLVDDDGRRLNGGAPKGQLPHVQERKMNYRAVQGSKYGVEADRAALNSG